MKSLHFCFGKYFEFCFGFIAAFENHFSQIVSYRSGCCSNRLSGAFGEDLLILIAEVNLMGIELLWNLK